MIVNRLNILNYKNHSERNLEFSSQINCFIGDNGAGKTNILDALHYISMVKSFLGGTDLGNIYFGEDFFALNAEISYENKVDSIKIFFSKEQKKKTIKKNDKSYSRISEHIGYLPSVMISPYDSNLISDSGESRRRFLDAMIAQISSSYLFDLLQYNKILQQRNALLKIFAKNKTFDKESLGIYTEPLVKYGVLIHQKRKEFVQDLIPKVQYFYQVISGGREAINIQYDSTLNENDFLAQLVENEQKDRALTYTSVGIHKDDLLLEMNGFLLKKIGSQGQQKSFLIALKLAQIERIKKLTSRLPILLLDDIFDKLDKSRVRQLIEVLNQENFGQIFLTDTDENRVKEVLECMEVERKIFNII